MVVSKVPQFSEGHAGVQASPLFTSSTNVFSPSSLGAGNTLGAHNFGKDEEFDVGQ